MPALRALLTLVLVPLCLVGLALALVRAGADAGARTWVGAVLAAAAGAASFHLLQSLARRPWARDSALAGSRAWLLVLGLLSVPLWDDLPPALELALVAFGEGYFLAALVFVARRLLRFLAARASARRGATSA